MATIDRRRHDDKYARIALQFHDKLRKAVGRFALAGALHELADYLEREDNGKHEQQHLLMLAAKWVKALA